MASDLITRAMERLAQRDKPTLVERAAERLAQSQQSAQPQPQAQPVIAGANFGPSPATAPIQPVQPQEMVRPAPRTRQKVQIDWGRMQLQGMLTPQSEATRLTEEFRIVKRPLLNKAFGESGERVPRGNLIMVTSSRPGEGKTFVALNLAISMASEKGLNVLLIDSDFHNPSIPKRMGFSLERGLIDALKDPSIDLSDVLVRTDLPNLTILPAGSESIETTEILASQRMANVVDELSRRYPDRIVIFDAPPALASSEPSVMAQHVGQVVFVVEAESTGASVIQDALGLIGNCPNISLLLNKRQPLGGPEGFGSYYGYGAVSS